MDITTRFLSSLTKVFPSQAPQSLYLPLTLVQKDSLSFQFAYYLRHSYRHEVTLEFSSPISDLLTLYKVELSPSNYPCHPQLNDNRYLSTDPGLFPDRLEEIPLSSNQNLIAEQWRSFWIKVTTKEDSPLGEFPITVRALDNKKNLLFEKTQTLSILPSVLPSNPLYHTEWFHSDCIADYYQVPPLSSQHFDIMENFISLAVKRDINTILTPVFTPPLDTQIGGERTTVQLVQVFYDNHTYSFDFSLLEKWVAMCKRCGITYYEISHLFSQWGAKYPPKVMGMVNGKYQQLFGWKDQATGEGYTTFLQAFLPALIEKLKSLGIDKQCLFHISDEPSIEHLDQYKAAKSIVLPYLKDYLIIDALSDFDFYQKRAVSHPIPANNHIEPFLAEKVPDLWTYYCTAQSKDVSNRFFALPSACNRIIGVQMYKYAIKGFLHWGYNFYNSQYSLQKINPYLVTDAAMAFPSGDSFLVYPGAEGIPEESIRLVVLEEAFHDLRALYLLESRIGREKVLALIEEDLGTPLTFSHYPIQESYLLNLRKKVNHFLATSV